MKLTNWLWKTKTEKRKIVLVVLVQNNKVLILRRVNEYYMNNAGMWGFPGGGIDEGETPLEAVIRECEEEIGVEPIDLSFLTKNKRLIWFKGKLPTSPTKCVKLNFEHSDWAMIGIEDIDKYDLIEHMAEIIKGVLKV